MTQVELQLASPSQASSPAVMPSPQMVSQSEGLPVQYQPDSRVQVVLQPSPLTLFSSSQSSSAEVMPSPQLTPTVQVEVEPVQLQPASI